MRRNLYKALALLLVSFMLVGCGKAGGETEPDTEKNSEAVTEETESVEETEKETEKEPEPVVSTVTITATGDCALGVLETHGYQGSFHSYYDSYGEAYFFEKFKEIFENDDLTLINLEVSLTDSMDIVAKEFNIKGPKKYTGIMASSAVEACSLGNNHTYDYGQKGLEDTISALQEANLAYAYNDIVAYYTTDEDVKVAIVSASIIASSGGVNEKYLISGIQSAKESGADLVIVACHWGTEGDNYANDYQRKWGHDLIDAGADLIIGNHSHCLQGVEQYKGKIICYSLGNFSFGANRNPGNKDTAVYQQTFTFVDGVLQSDITAKMIPARVSGYNNYNNFQPIIANAEQASVIIKNLNAYSAPYGGVYFDEQGNLLIKTAE